MTRSDNSHASQPEPDETAHNPGWVDHGGGAGEPDRLERLWAPYRKAYFNSRSEDPFVDAPQRSDEDALIVARGETVYCLLNLFPYNAGHLLVVPYRKVANLEDLTEAESSEMMGFSQKAVRVLKKVGTPAAINIGMNLGKASGGSVDDHVHLHIVPRWHGDTNFLTIVDGTKVLPELLRDTRTMVAQGWSELDEEEGDERH